MKRSRKFVLVTVLATLALVGSITGVVLADDSNGSEPEALLGALWDRVAAIYEDNTGVAIEPEALKDAFAQARSEKLQEALDSHLQSLVDEGKITQDQADQYKEWWQSRPEVPVGPGFGGHGGLRGWGGPCAPPPAE